MEDLMPIVNALGGPKAFPGLRRRNPAVADVLAVVRGGLRVSAVQALAENLDLPSERLRELVGIPARTWSRRQQSGALAPDESDRLYRVGRVFAHALDALGDPAGARAWLTEANRALGGAVPFDLLDTDAGAEAVDDVLTRLEEVVYG